MTKRILLFVLIVLLSLHLGFFAFDSNQAVELVSDYGYAWMLLIHALFIWCLLSSLRGDLGEWREWGRQRWGGLIFLLLASGFLHLHERHEFKIVADELVIGNTAMQMHYQREASMAVRAYDYASNYTVFTSFPDKRPLAFPFLLTMVHDLTGYRVTNVFWLNGLVGSALVALLWLVSCRLGGRKAGYASVLLLCGVPLIAQNVTGAGFELYNMTLILLTLWLGMRYAERPDRARLGAFVLSGIILAQVRYESAIFVVPVGATILWVWWRDRKVELSSVVLASPLLMLLVPLQYNVFKVREATWQLSDVEGATSPFGLRYFYDNVGHAINFFLKADGSQPNSWLLGVVGVIATGFCLLLIYREHRTMAREEPARLVAAIFLGGLLLHTAVMLCYFWGKWDDPIIRRLSLPAHVLLLVAIPFVWTRLIRHPRAWDGLIIAAVLQLMFFGIPASARHVFTQENFAAATCNWVSDHIRRSVPGSALAIDDNGGHVWFLHRKACISPDRLSINWRGYVHHFERRSFSDYLVVQRIGVNQANDEKYISLKDDFGQGLQLQLIEERAFAPFYIMRISRVVGVDSKKLQAWAEERQKARAAAKEEGRREIWMSEPISVDLLSEWFKALP